MSRTGVATRKSCGILSSIQAGLLGNYAAEMIFFLFKIAEAMLEPTVRLFIYEGICLQEVNSHHRCKYLDRYPNYEAVVQSKSASYLMYYKILLNVPAVLLVLVCGAWSDKTGRKLPIMLTCFGSIVSVILYMLSSQVGGGKGPYLPLVLVGAGIRGSFGRSAIMTMACHSYVSDISTKTARTRKLAHLVAMSHFGYLTGCTVAGSLLDTTGFVFVFCVVIFIQATCFLVASVCMRDMITMKTLMNSPKKEANNNESQEEVEIVESKCCDVGHLRACYAVIGQPRRGKVRCYIVILFIASVIQQTCKSGEMDMTLLFVERAPLFWVRSLYSYLLGVDYACLGIMSFFVLPLLVQYCHMTDVYLALLGLIFKIGRTLMLAFSTSTWMVFTAVAIGGPHSFTISGIKSMISKLVDEDEIGKAFSVISSLETVSNLFGTVLFTNVYASTLSLWTGLGFALEAGLYVVLFLMMCGLLCGATKECEDTLQSEENESSSCSDYGSDESSSGSMYGSIGYTTSRESPVMPIPPRVTAVERPHSVRSEVVYSYDFESSGCVNRDNK